MHSVTADQDHLYPTLDSACVIVFVQMLHGVEGGEEEQEKEE